MKKLFLFLLILFSCCARFDAQTHRLPAPQSPVAPVEPILIRPFTNDARCRQWVDSVLNKMSLKERIGQLFIYTIAPQQDKANRDLLRKVVDDYKVGGLLFSGGLMENQVALTNEAQKMADIPLMITFDGEWDFPCVCGVHRCFSEIWFWAVYKTTACSMSTGARWPGSAVSLACKSTLLPWQM